MKARRKSRIAALEALYELDITSHAPGAVLEARAEEHKLNEGQLDFAHQLVFGVIKERTRLDRWIAKFAPDYPVDQIAVVERNILRIALWEFAVSGLTPVSVAIDEAVEVAKLYGSESAPRFVNGVLGSLAAHASEFAPAVEQPAKKRKE